MVVFHSSRRWLAVQVPDGIDVGHEIVAVRKRANELLLHVALRLANADAVVLGELFEQPIPWRSIRSQSSPVGILQLSFAVSSPLLEQHGSEHPRPAKNAARAFSKQRPKHSDARVSFSLQPSRYR